MKISEQLKSVLCDPSGNASIHGSQGDLSAINDALSALVNLENKLEALAKKYDPDFEAGEYWNTGNYDDSYGIGVEGGENCVYREIKTILESK